MMSQLSLFDATPSAPPRALAPAAPPPPADKPTRGRKREPEPPAPPVVISEPQLPPDGALAHIGGRWHRWRDRVGLCGEAMGWEPLKPHNHAAHARVDAPPKLQSNGQIAETYPAPATIHMDGVTLRIEWSEYGFSIHHEGKHLRHFSTVAGCAVAAAEIARADDHFRQRLASLKGDPDDPDNDPDDDGPSDDPPAPAPPPTPAEPQTEAEHSRFWQDGHDARCAGLPRRLPGYLLETYRDTPERIRRYKQAEWLAGWDAAEDPAPVDTLAVHDSAAEPDGHKLLAELSPRLTPLERGRLITQLHRQLEELRRVHSTDAAKEKKAKATAKLTRTDIRRAFRSVCPRPFTAVVADAWAIVDEYDRLCRAGTEDERRRALNLALDELFIEANGGDTCGTAVFHGPKRLRKALRVRARAEKRWPMWGVEGRFRFHWRGLTMIAETRWGGIHLDTDRHPPGTLCHSSSGYRSFSGGGREIGCSPEESAARLLDAFVDGPTKHGMGLGGKLQAYFPWWADDYRQALKHRQEATPDYRRDHPAMTPAEERPAYWAALDAKFAEQKAEAERKAAAIGFDLARFCGDVLPRQNALL